MSDRELEVLSTIAAIVYLKKSAAQMTPRYAVRIASVIIAEAQAALKPEKTQQERK